MKRIRSTFYKLRTLKDAKPKVRKAIVSNCDKELNNSVSECALNVLRGNVNLTDCHKRKLGKYRRQLRTVVDKLERKYLLFSAADFSFNCCQQSCLH